MTTATIELERYDSWSTYGTDPYGLTDYDPLEHQNYDEELVFPLLKPDPDVLSPAFRWNRRQRGWYQITRPGSASQSSSPKSFATGADLPAELLRMIVGEVDTRNCDWPVPEERKTGRRRIGLFACVCRDWAEHFHAPLFFNSIIPSVDVVLSLLAVLRSSAIHGRGRLQRHMKHLVLRYNPASLPWLHLMPTVYALLATPPDVNLLINGPLTEPCPPSLHARLPRTLPPLAFTTGIRSLNLLSVHFRSFADFARLRCGLPHLTYMHCGELTWDTVLSPSHFRNIRVAGTTSLGYIQLRGCTAIWPAVWLILLGRLRPSDEDCALLGALAQAIEGAGVFTTCWCGEPRFDFEEQDRFSTCNTRAGGSHTNADRDFVQRVYSR